MPEAELYEAALTVMMRLVFLFCAEEREPAAPGRPALRRRTTPSRRSRAAAGAADQHGEEVLERRLDAWRRLLATFRAVYGGLRARRGSQLPAYGGQPVRPRPLPVPRRPQAGDDLAGRRGQPAAGQQPDGAAPAGGPPDSCR